MSNSSEKISYFENAIREAGYDGELVINKHTYTNVASAYNPQRDRWAVHIKTPEGRDMSLRFTVDGSFEEFKQIVKDTVRANINILTKRQVVSV